MRFLSGEYWSRALSNPWVAAGLAVDLAPVFAVVVLGWRAAPLVLLYWLENLIIGVATLARIISAGFAKGVAGGVASLFMGAFFTVHYGLFCFVHGVFLFVLASEFGGGDIASLNPDDPMNPAGLVGGALIAAPGMSVFVLLLIIWQAAMFVDDFVLKNGALNADPAKEMFAPYGRIVVLHIGIFAGFAALAAIGEPMIGVLGLILLRAVWGLFMSSRRWGPLFDTPTLTQRHE
ncbi:MAG: DUF6498-containing protein [Pseudomonadota bacterium]